MTKNASKRRSVGDEASKDVQSRTQEQGTYKRRRVALACTSCRNRKSRCNGAKPACGLCVQLGFECIYEQPANPQSQSSARATDTYEDRLKSVEAMLGMLVNQQNWSSNTASEVTVPTQQPAPEAPSLRRVSEVAVIGDDEVCLLETSEDTMDGLATIGEYNVKDARFFGPSSNISLLSTISKIISAAYHTRVQSQRHPYNAQEERLVSQMPSPQASISVATPAALPRQNTCALPPTTHAIAMIENFFADTGMLFPFISKHSVMSQYQEAQATGFRAVRRSWLCLLNMIFAFATFTDTSNTPSLEKNISESLVFFHRAQDLLAESRFRLADLDLVQCLLLMSQYRQGTQRSDETWTLHGLAVHAATQLGLHCAQPTMNSNPHEYEIRKRTWFACVLLDSTLSMALGRPPSISSEFVALDLPRAVDLDTISRSQDTNAVTEEDVPLSTSSLFIATILLYRIQNQIIARLYLNNLSLNTNANISTLTADIAGYEAKLDEWHSKLEPKLKLRPWISNINQETSEDAVFDRLSVIMWLRFLHTKSLLHRVVIQSLCESRLESGFASSSSDTSFTTIIGQQSLSACLRYAIEIIEIVHSMSKVRSRLGGWWFSIYYTFHATLLLVACLVYHFESSSSVQRVLLPIWIYNDIENAAKSLLKGQEAIEKVGQGTRLSKRISKTISKLVETIANIAYTSHQDVTPIQTLLDSLVASGRVNLTQIPDANGVEGEDPHIPANESYDFGADSSNFWLQDQFDILTDLGGLDVGLTGFTAA